MKLGPRLIWSFGAALVSLAVLLFWRNFFLQHAIISAVAIGGLIYSVLHSAHRWRQTYRP